MCTQQQDKGALGGSKGIDSEFEQPLVGPTPSQPLNSREGYWRHHLSTLYSPPVRNKTPALDLAVQQEDEFDDDEADLANVESPASFHMSIDAT